MTTRTIREADITITIKSLNGYRLLELGTGHQEGVHVWAEGGTWHRTYAEAIQARADIIDGRAGAARVGDIVRIGLKGVQVYAVASIVDDTLALAYKDSAGTPRWRRVAMDRVHLVEGVR